MEMISYLVLFCGLLAVVPASPSTHQRHDFTVKTFYDSSVSELVKTRRDFVKYNLVSAAVDWLQRVIDVVNEPPSIVALERTCRHGVFLSTARQRYCRGGCSFEERCGPAVIPQSHLKPCHGCSKDGSTCSTWSPSSSPVADVHYVLYVSVKETWRCSMCLQRRELGHAVSAGHCQQHPQTERPIAGYLNICPAALTSGQWSFNQLLGAVLHELLRSLAFSEELAAFFRDWNSRPLSARDQWDTPVMDSSGRYILDIVERVWQVNWTSANESWKRVRYLTTPAVTREVRAHFNCSSLIGAPLEDQAGGRLLWEKRLFGSELMTADLSSSPVISNITLAMLEDTGWYWPDYQYGGYLSWGRGMGCGFINDSCWAWINQNGLERKSMRPFCAEGEEQPMLGCSPGRQAVSHCQTKEYVISLPKQFQYWTNSSTRGGVVSAADFCPTYEMRSDSAPFRSYAGAADKVDMTLESHSDTAVCFEHHFPWSRKSKLTGETVTQSLWGAGYYEFACRKQAIIVYINNGTKIRRVYCKHAGDIKMFRITVKDDIIKGNIVCPDHTELCQDYECEERCSGHGVCVNHYCHCHPGYSGPTCSTSYYTETFQ